MATKKKVRQYEIKICLVDTELEVLKDALHLYDRLEKAKSNKKIANNLLDMIDYQHSQQAADTP